MATDEPRKRKPKTARTKIPDDAPVAPLRIDEELHLALRQAAKKGRVGVTRMANIIIGQYLEREGFLESGSHGP